MLGRRSWITGLLGSGAVALAALSGLRWLNISSPLLYGLVPLAPLGLLVCLLTLGIWATAKARRSVGGGAAVIAVGLAIWMLPGSLPPNLFCPSVRTDSIVFYSHNVSYESGDPLLVAEQIAEIDPDVVLLQEADPEFVASVQQQLPNQYPEVVQAASEQTLSLAILSRGPLDDVVDTTGASSSRNPMLFASMELAGQRLRIGNVHLSAPRSGDLVARRKAELDYLSKQEREADVLAGDFNSSQAHRDFRTAVGARDGKVAARCGLGGTWSPLRFGPGAISLDHVVLSERWSSDVVVRASGYAGSDHRALVFELGA